MQVKLLNLKNNRVMIIYELLWFIKGDTNVKYVLDFLTGTLEL